MVDSRIFLAVLLFAAFAGGSLNAETVFVVSPSARLLKKQALTSATADRLEKGEKLELIEKDGLFYKVKYRDGRDYWISRLFVSFNAPGKSFKAGEVGVKSRTFDPSSLSSSIKSGLGSDAGASQKVPDQELDKNFDFNSVEWFENHSPDHNEIRSFMIQGGLKIR